MRLLGSLLYCCRAGARANRRKHAARQTDGRLHGVGDREARTTLVIHSRPSRRPLGPRKTTSTFLPRHSHTLARAPRTFSAFPAHVARLLPTRTHARRSLILHNCIFYRPYETSLTIGHFICKLPKNNVANVCAILEGAEPPIASPSASRDGSTFRSSTTLAALPDTFFRHI